MDFSLMSLRTLGHGRALVMSVSILLEPLSSSKNVTSSVEVPTLEISPLPQFGA
jgi:hypothetical protein